MKVNILSCEKQGKHDLNRDLFGIEVEMLGKKFSFSMKARHAPEEHDMEVCAIEEYIADKKVRNYIKIRDFGFSVKETRAEIARMEADGIRRRNPCYSGSPESKLWDLYEEIKFAQNFPELKNFMCPQVDTYGNVYRDRQAIFTDWARPTC